MMLLPANFSTSSSSPFFSLDSRLEKILLRSVDCQQKLRKKEKEGEREREREGRMREKERESSADFTQVYTTVLITAIANWLKPVERSAAANVCVH